VSETTRKTYRGSQIEALYRAIFELQTGAGWQDERDFTAWRRSLGWSYRRPRRVPEMSGALAADGKALQGISQTKVEQFRKEIQTGRWDNRPSKPITVMSDGEVMEGHHRLAAASEVDWATVPNDPTFAVVFRPDVIPD
jgi:hypothetical protein